MKKTFTLLAVLCASLSVFSVNTATWEIKTDAVDGGFPKTATGRVLFADYNNDGILDYFIIAGQGTGNIGLFKGNADGTYTNVTETSPELYAKSQSSALFLDINNDGNLDLITVGKDDGGNTLTDVYINSGAPDFKFVTDYDLVDALPGLSTESNDNGSKILVAFDYNNDGWTDLLINGNAGGAWEEITGGNGQSRVTAIIANNKGKLALLKNPVDGTDNFISLNGGSVDVADFNKDGWMDVIVTGYNDNESTVTKLYKNNGNGTFSLVNGIEFVGHQQGETAFIDINNDGFMDIIEIGRDVKNGWANYGKLYINNNGESFTRLEESTTNLFGGSCALAIGDVNNDGLMDFFMSGWGTNSTFMYNNGDNTFTKQDINPDAARCRGGAVSFANLNNDGFLDMSIFGYRDGGGDVESGGDGLGVWPNYILMNKGGDGIAANEAPSAPKNFTAVYNDSKQCYELRWENASDKITPAEALRYNIYVKTADGKVNFLCPADMATGALKIQGTQHPLISGNQYDLYVEKEGVEIGIQAVDQGYLGSNFVTPGASGMRKMENDFHVFASGKTIFVQNNAEKEALVEVIAVDGTMVSKQNCAIACTASVNVYGGAYIVKVTMGATTQVTKVMAY